MTDFVRCHAQHFGQEGCESADHAIAHTCRTQQSVSGQLSPSHSNIRHAQNASLLKGSVIVDGPASVAAANASSCSSWLRLKTSGGQSSLTFLGPSDAPASPWCCRLAGSITSCSAAHWSASTISLNDVHLKSCSLWAPNCCQCAQHTRQVWRSVVRSTAQARIHERGRGTFLINSAAQT
jgi:hypothetical protein